MNKQKFINILHDFDNIPDQDRDKLHELAKSYPYSQIIHTLVAKANNDAHTAIAGNTLHYAAMYATDRSVLKGVIQHTPTNGSEIRPCLEKETLSPPETSPSRGDKQTSHASKKFSLDADELRKEVWLDLAALKKTKASYHQWLEEDGDTKKVKATSSAAKNSAPAAKKVPAAEKAEKPKTKKKESKKKMPAAKAKKAKPQSKPQKKKETGGKSTPHEDQREIIESFITNEPSLTARPLKVSDNQPDLSEASTSYNDDLISENLAQIFINQGKKEKAIDIYKKLIWKFPQKKGYFASRIEDLQ